MARHARMLPSGGAPFQSGRSTAGRKRSSRPARQPPPWVQLTAHGQPSATRAILLARTQRILSGVSTLPQPERVEAEDECGRAGIAGRGEVEGGRLSIYLCFRVVRWGEGGDGREFPPPISPCAVAVAGEGRTPRSAWPVSLSTAARQTIDTSGSSSYLLWYRREIQHKVRR
eukprot:scaffold48708_cov63-Phaeocystis_antarctica.AAC.5